MDGSGDNSAKNLKYICVLLLAGILLPGVASFGALQADFNMDGVVNFEDFEVLASEWLRDTNGIVPSPKYETTFPSLGIVRDSIAYDAEFRELPENVGRHEYICVASRPTVWVNTDVGRLVQDIDGDLIICSDYLPVYTTTDGDNFTELLNISTDSDFAGYYEVNDHIRSVKVMKDGSWLLSTGRLNIDGSGSRGDLFRSVDKGLTWTHVLEYERGYTPYWGWCAVSDNEIAIGEYGYLYQSNNPRRIYYSDDYGTTWSKIWEPPPEPGRHIHLVAFPPSRTDVIYVSSGDVDASNRVEKVEYTPGAGGKRNIANWSETVNSPILERENCPTSAFSDGRYLYLGRDAYMSPVLWRLDPNNDSVTCSLNWPEYVDDLNHPYRMSSGGGQIFSMVLHESVYYVAARGRGPNNIGGGIYVSTDGEHWTCAYRVEGVGGFHNIVGFANGYLWGTYYDTTRRLYKMSPVRAELVKAMRVERGVTNQFITPETSSFEGGDGGWGPRSPFEDINDTLTGMSTDMSLHGTSSYKIVIEDKGYSGADVSSGFCPVSPALGDYVCASFWIRPAPTRPTGYNCFARIKAVGTGEIDSMEDWFCLVQNQGWERKTVWGRCIDDNFDNGIHLWLGLREVGYGGDYSNATCYVDCVQMVYFNDLHYSGPWQIGGTPRTDEIATGSLAGLGVEFTTSFEWRPERSRREWHDNVYIASWTDGQEHIDLYYDDSNSGFVATDGTNTAATTQVFSWDHTDSIKFALAHMEDDFRLSVLTPLNGVEHALTDNGNIMLGPPVAITFGTDSWRTNYGCGLIANVKHFDSALTVSQVNQIFDLANLTTP